ncbi:MAG: ATP-binding protein [Verrucomicrobiaceae bacterium]|nr:MAG: ATP-binding protein [Verrucomicrobiaceae bacterium]
MTTMDLCEYAPLLYIPANRPGLEQFLFERRDDAVRNIAICLEDAVRPDERYAAAQRLADWLPRLASPHNFHCYVRPADEALLATILDLPGAEHLSGFIIPKTTPEKLAAWALRSSQRFPLLPILETRDALDPDGRRELAAACADFRRLIPRVRIGANDLLSLLGGLRRPRGRTIYETPLGRVVDSLIEVFSGIGLPLAGSVFDRLDDLETLARECRDDVDRGLFAKTALNPRQVAFILETYRPDASEVDEARRILHAESPAVFALNGSMHEPACHTAWAQRLLRRATAFGTVESRSSGDGNSEPASALN